MNHAKITKADSIVHLTVVPSHPTIGASFVEVLYGGDKTAIVNTDCAIVHLLLHLRAKCVGDGFAISDNVLIEGSRISFKKEKMTKHEQYTDEDEIEYLDLLDKTAMPIELYTHDPLSIASPYLKHRSEYVLCSLKKARDGTILDAKPLLSRPSWDLRRRIQSVLKSMEKFKTKNEKVTKTESKRKHHHHKKGH